MIRVNLLPGYVAQRRLTYKMIGAYVVLFILILVVVLTFTFGSLIPRAVDREAQAQQAVDNKAKVDSLRDQATAVTAAVQPTKAKLDFVTLVHEYNKQWVERYDTLARYTDLKVIYSSAVISGTSMSIAAFTPSIKEIGLYLERIYAEPDFNTVSIDHLPGYPEALVHKYYLNGKLIGVSSPSTNTAATGGFAGATQAPAMTGGGGGGRGRGPNGGGGGGGGFGGGGGGFSGAGMAANGERIYSVEEVLADQINPLGTPEQRQRTIERALRGVVVKSEPAGFNVNITATLKTALTPPSVPSGGAAAAPSGGGGGGGGNPPPGAGGNRPPNS